jgi:hypothetical protein
MAKKVTPTLTFSLIKRENILSPTFSFFRTNKIFTDKAIPDRHKSKRSGISIIQKSPASLFDAGDG